MAKYKLGIIGTGVMGQAILHSAVSAGFLKQNDISLFDVNEDVLSQFSNTYATFSSAQDLLDQTEYVLFSVKPQHFEALASSINVKPHNNFISIMAGLSTNTIQKKLASRVPITRVMPNTPCKVGYGTCAICFDNVTKEAETFVSDLFSPCGKVFRIEEKYFDAVTSVSGSGPAYVYMFLQGMIQGGINGGLTDTQSKELAINTMIGAAKLAEVSNESLDVLVERVCSKGGTTIEAVNTYRENNLTEIIAKGIDACRKRSEELSKQ